MRKLCLALLLALLLPAVAVAATVTWKPNTEADIASYSLYRNGEPVADIQHDPSQLADVRDPLTGAIEKKFAWHDPNIPEVCTDDWRVTATDTCGNESALSDRGKSQPPFAPAGVVFGP